MKTHFIVESDLPNIAQDGLSTMEIATRFNHHGLMLDFTDGGVKMSEAEIIADVESINLSVKVRGGGEIELIKDVPPDVIFDCLNQYREASKSAYTYEGVMYIPFTRPDLGQLVNPNALVIGMANIEHYLLQVKFNDVVLKCDKCVVIPEVDKLRERPLGEHIRFEKFERSHAAVSVESVNGLPFGEPNTAMLGYHVDLGATGVIGDIEVNADGEVLFSELTPTRNNLMLHKAGRTPQSGFMHVDFNLKGGALPVGTYKSFRQKINWTTAPNAYVLYTDIVYDVGQANY